MRAFNISIEIGDLLAGSALTRDAFPNLAYAVQRITEQAMSNWQAYAAGAPLPDGRILHTRSGTYLRSIQMRMTGDFSGEAYSNLPYALGIEEGLPSYDMKRWLGSSLKVRVNASGKRYLIIPFRHDTPGALSGGMPEAVHAWWQDPGRDRSRVIGFTRRVSGTGAWSVKTRAPYTLRQRHYRWGSRLTRSDLDQLGVSEAVAKRLEGMVNFRQSAASPKHSKYLTFRVMSEESRGWIRPAMDGYRVAEQTAEQLRPIAEEVIRKAVQADIQALLAPG